MGIAPDRDRTGYTIYNDGKVISPETVGKPREPNYNYTATPEARDWNFRQDVDYSKLRVITPEMSKKLWDSIDKDLLQEFRFWVHANLRKWEIVYDVRHEDDYGVDLHTYPALHPNVEYFGFFATTDQRIAYMCSNIMENNKIGLIDKMGNALASHFYGDTKVHEAMTGELNPKDALVDYTKLAKEQLDYKKTGKVGEYTQWMRNFLEEQRRKGVKFWSMTELHTSLQTAARYFLEDYYGDDYSSATPTNNINEWIASWKNTGLMEKIGNAGSMKQMSKLLGTEWGIGPYYQFHGGGDLSLIPELNGFIDERFVIPGPGAIWTTTHLFPNISRKEVSDEDRVLWIRENQKELFDMPEIHPFFHNIDLGKNYNNADLFKESINELKTYQTEVCCCQFGIYQQIKGSRKKIESRKVDYGLGMSNHSCMIDSQGQGIVVDELEEW